MVISGEDVCCNVVFGTLVDVYVFSVMWSKLKGNYSRAIKEKILTHKEGNIAIKKN